MRWFITALAALIALHTTAVWGQDTGEQAMLELVVNGAPRGDTFVLLRGDDVLVPQKSLIEAGLTRLEAATETHDGLEYISLRSAALPFDYDEHSLSLTITAPPAVLSRTTIDMSNASPTEVRYDYSPSWFLNYAPRLIDGDDLQVFAETGLSLGKLLVDTSATYTPEHGPIRLLSKATYDDRAHLRTATLGDTFVSAGALGGALTLGGLSVASNYELDPYLVKLPRLGFTGSTLSPGTVDVYVNDVLIRRVPVDPGEFQLNNISPLAGAGSTRYVVRDAYGREQRIESHYYSSSGVLAPGLSEYNYGVGLVRQGLGSESFNYGAPAVIGRHRFGLSEHVTPGFHVEFGESLVNGGSDLTIAGQFGEVELHAGGSAMTTAGAELGAAGIIGYSYQSPRASLRSVLRGTSRRYVNLGLGPEQYRSLVEYVTTTNYAIAPRASLATDIALALSHTYLARARFGVTINAQLSRDIGLQVRSSRGTSQLGRWEHDLFGTLTWSLPGGHFAQLSEQTAQAGTTITGNLTRALHGTTGIGYQASGSVGAQNRGSVNVQAQSTPGRLSGTYTNVGGNSSTLLEASGAIVIVGGKPYFSRPITQSYALLRVPGAEHVRGYVNNREMGTTDASGDLFVPDLIAYQRNLLRINQADLPLDYQLEQDEIALAPPRRGGAVIEFSVRRVRLTRGRVVRGKGRHPPPVKFATMSVETPGGPFTSLLGMNGEFELDGLRSGRWTAKVDSPEGPCEVSFEIPEIQATVRYLGTLVCVDKSSDQAKGKRKP